MQQPASDPAEGGFTDHAPGAVFDEEIAAQVSPQTRAIIIAAPTNALAFSGQPDGSRHEPIGDTIRGAFTSATHYGYLAGASVALLIVTLALSTIRSPRQPARPGRCP